MLGIKKWISAIRLSKEALEDVTQADKEQTETQKQSKERSEGDLRRRKGSKVKSRKGSNVKSSKGSKVKSSKGRSRSSSKKESSTAKCHRVPSTSSPHLDGQPLPSAVSSWSNECLSAQSRQSSKLSSQRTATTARSAAQSSKSSESTAMSGNALISTWWECTPSNLHTVTLNFLYDTDNSRCDLIWTILENLLKYPRQNMFYGLLVALFIYIAFNEPARFTYYVIGFAYPMFKTFRVFKYRRSSEYSSILRYWVVFGWFALVDVFLYSCMEQRSIYWSLKALFAIYLHVPFIRGSDLLYHDFARSFTKRIQIIIDQFSYYHETPTSSDFVDRRGID